MTYLVRLKQKSRQRHVTNLQNQQNMSEAGFAGFAGSLAGDFQKSANDTTPTVRATRWLLHFVDRDPVEVWFSPAAEYAEAMVWYPDAVAAEPFQPIIEHQPMRNFQHKEHSK